MESAFAIYRKDLWEHGLTLLFGLINIVLAFMLSFSDGYAKLVLDLLIAFFFVFLAALNARYFIFSHLSRFLIIGEQVIRFTGESVNFPTLAFRGKQTGPVLLSEVQDLKVEYEGIFTLIHEAFPFNLFADLPLATISFSYAEKLYSVNFVIGSDEELSQLANLLRIWYSKDFEFTEYTYGRKSYLLGNG